MLYFLENVLNCKKKRNMLGIQFIKFSPTTYVIHYKHGKVKREGKGLAFYYYAPSSSIVAIPSGTNDAAFFFNESTSDFQQLSIQGVITYKVDNPKMLAEMLDFSVDALGEYKSEDFQKVTDRLINEAHTSIINLIQSLELKDSVKKAKEIAKEIFIGLEASETLKSLGVSPLGVNVQAIKPTAEMSRALETSTRELLQKEADKAIYDRRNFAVEQEKKIKQSEMDTEIAVEEKRKEISEKRMDTELMEQENRQMQRDKQLDADIDFEGKKQNLIDLQTSNERKQADADAYRLDKVISIYKSVDWKVLSLIMKGKGTSAENISMAFRELAENAEKINHLNISPDLLNTLMQQSETQYED